MSKAQTDKEMKILGNYIKDYSVKYIEGTTINNPKGK